MSDDDLTEEAIMIKQLTDEWKLIEDQWTELTQEQMLGEASAALLRQTLPRRIHKYRKQLLPDESHSIDSQLAQLDPHIAYTGQVYLNLLEIGFDKEQAFILLCGISGI